jgi:RNA polymerase sigma factor (sigma-70 family)
VTDDEILRDYLPWLRVVAGNLAGFDSPDLQDLVQEGYIAMWRALRTYDPASGKLDYWLKFKASNRMKTIAIRAAEHPEREPLDLDQPRTTEGDTLADLLEGPDLIAAIDIAYHHGEIAAAIDRLTPQQRRYVIARFWLGLTGNEMVALGVFSYDPSALWNSKRNGARWKLQEELKHLALR